MRIDCPCCGPRSLHEFAYGGDATRSRPPEEETASGPWEAYVYDRANPRGRHEELWHHVGGCRHWLRLTRDTATHEIFNVSLIGPFAGRKVGR